MEMIPFCETYMEKGSGILGNDPFQKGLLSKDLYYAKRCVEGHLAVVMDGKAEKRGLELIVPKARAVRRHEMHELIFTCDSNAAPGRRVDPISFLGFMDVETGGVISQGDQVYVDDAPVGYVAGFDETHSPNHLNIVIICDHDMSGREIGAKLESRILICK